MNFFSRPQLLKLLNNGAAEEAGKDHAPVVKLYLPKTDCCWLISELDVDNPLMALALYSTQFGSITFDYVNLEHVAAIRNKEKIPVLRDTYFVGKYPMSVYFKAAFTYGFITDQDVLLQGLRHPPPPPIMRGPS